MTPALGNRHGNQIFVVVVVFKMYSFQSAYAFEYSQINKICDSILSSKAYLLDQKCL